MTTPRFMSTWDAGVDGLPQISSRTVAPQVEHPQVGVVELGTPRFSISLPKFDSTVRSLKSFHPRHSTCQLCMSFGVADFFEEFQRVSAKVYEGTFVIPLSRNFKIMVLTRARAKALAVEGRRQCFTVSEEPEDPGIPDLIVRRKRDYKSFVEQHRVLDCQSMIKKGDLATKELLVAMEATQHEKLSERRSRKALRDAQKKNDVTDVSESDAPGVEHKAKRVKVDIPVPPPQTDNSKTTLEGEVEELKQKMEETKILWDDAVDHYFYLAIKQMKFLNPGVPLNTKGMSTLCAVDDGKLYGVLPTGKVESAPGDVEPKSPPFHDEENPAANAERGPDGALNSDEVDPAPNINMNFQE
ncbi:hypothetical protein SESBI_18306 [Sesbania bispinosa]|nr:hypothetical protein SESBI_18306 [Sesbania bispinosa]